ncbi:MAG: UDP-N-acetylmuramoyl-tripeptide--D-alanyl-D-alanine ligase [Salibacteraceae bacterium]
MSELLEKFIECNYQVCTDTRNIIPGSIFFALKGDNFNGNQYANKAIELGAKYAVIDEDEFYNNNTLLVDDVLTTLQQLANEYRNTFNIPVLGITGSNGKTTAKELIHSVISQKFKCHSTPGNFNNHIGLPLTILGMPMGAEFLILEMGDNHSGEIKTLSEIGNPTHALVTNVGKDHIEGFGSFENNKLAKKELFDYVELTKGTAFIPSFEEELIDMSSGVADRVFFGSQSGYSYVEHTKSDPFIHFRIEGNKEASTNLIGDYNIKNVEMANCIGKYFKVETEDIYTAISKYQPKNNRSQFIESNGHKVFLDAYNANPSSVELALDSFDKQHLLNNRVVILGDMLELGEESTKEHQTIADRISKLDIKAYLIGSEYSKTKKHSGISYFDNRKELIEFLNENPLPKSQILIKGSRGIRLEETLEHL